MVIEVLKSIPAIPYAPVISPMIILFTFLLYIIWEHNSTIMQETDDFRSTEEVLSFLDRYIIVSHLQILPFLFRRENCSLSQEKS